MHICGLCKESVQSLKESHFIPARFYRAMTRSHNGYTSATPRIATNTSRQVWSYLLCGDCEGKFNKKGEDWVLKNYLNISQIKNIDVQKLVYFATSIFWRASAYSWHLPVGQPSVYPLQFGPYSEKLRNFLMGNSPFPDEASLGIFISQNPQHDCVIFPEEGDRISGGFRRYAFFIPGITFVLCLGQKIPSDLKNECAAHKNVLIRREEGEILARGKRKTLASPHSRQRRPVGSSQ